MRCGLGWLGEWAEGGLVEDGVACWFEVGGLGGGVMGWAE